MTNDWKKQQQTWLDGSCFASQENSKGVTAIKHFIACVKLSKWNFYWKALRLTSF